MKKLRAKVVGLSIKSTLKCPVCKGESLLGSWENNTLNDCFSRELRRAYISLEEARAYEKTTCVSYKCPLCNEYIRSFKLKLASDVEEE